MSGAGFPARFRSAEVLPSTTTSNRPVMPPAASTARALALDDTTAVFTPCDRKARTTATAPGKTSTVSGRMSVSTRWFFRVPSPWIESSSGGESGVPSGSVIPRDARKERTPSLRILPSTNRR